MEILLGVDSFSLQNLLNGVLAKRGSSDKLELADITPIYEKNYPTVNVLSLV